MVSLTSLTQASHHFIWEYFFKLWAKSSAQQLECTPSQHLLTTIAPFPGPPSPQFFLSYCTSKQRSTWRRRARNKANISCCYTRQGCTIIAENFWGTELSQNSRFCGYLQKFFFPQNLEAWHPLAVPASKPWKFSPQKFPTIQYTQRCLRPGTSAVFYICQDIPRDGTFIYKYIV